ncbi:MAG: translation initiation factor IF-2 [Candidatus Marinimicrobia bacterium CG08_land_8_20_14_0_20_45_22]|nr:MAG: translation initiation factor IF-2 [Candidatus Marinimicrobia bacterium CG08_land_8_20_14_0_20_45_22]
MDHEPKTRQKKIFEIAKELNISYIDIISFLAKEGSSSKSVNSPVDELTYIKILEQFAKEKTLVERALKERARKEAELKRKAQEDTQKAAELERRRMEEEVVKSAALLFQSAIACVIELCADIKPILIEQVREKIRKTDIIAEQSVEEAIGSEKTIGKPVTKSEIEVKGEKKKKDKEKRKLRRIAISDIESRLAQKFGKKKPETTDFSQKKGKHNKKGADIDEKKVDDSIRRTMAKIDGKVIHKKYKKGGSDKEEIEEITNRIRVSEFASVETLASLMDVSPADVIEKCIQMGMFVTINQRLDFTTITIIADEFGFRVEQVAMFGEELLKIDQTEEDLENSKFRAPVVAIMGHVDHGKTSLLDFIRRSNVVAGEFGGITQHIGAYQVILPNKKKITFLDTPGHEAFTAMRARGAQITDIVVLIVAADDGVMPRTIEAIHHAKAANVPIVVAINKIDKPEADAERVKRELADNDVLVETWGGKVQYAEISAKTGKGIDHLLDLILLESEMLDLKANYETSAQGTIVESKMDRRHGPTATILIQKGTLKIGDPFVCGAAFGKVRALFDERGQKLTHAEPSDPVVVIGFDILPGLADVFSVVQDEHLARKIAIERQKIQREQMNRQLKEWSLDTISAKIAEGKIKQLNVILKCDVDGSAEAINHALKDLGNTEVSVSVKHMAAGEISESDVLLAKASEAVIVAFNVSANPKVKEQAKKENIEIRYYSIIYELIDDIKAALEGMLSPDKIEEMLGEAEVREVFKIPKQGMIAGSYVVSGKVTRTARARLKRDAKVVHESFVESLKRFKDDAREVAEGFECGISIEGYDDYKIGDRIEFFEIKSVKRKLE